MMMAVIHHRHQWLAPYDAWHGVVTGQWTWHGISGNYLPDIEDCRRSHCRDTSVDTAEWGCRESRTYIWHTPIRCLQHHPHAAQTTEQRTNTSTNFQRYTLQQSHFVVTYVTLLRSAPTNRYVGMKSITESVCPTFNLIIKRYDDCKCTFKSQVASLVSKEFRRIIYRIVYSTIKKKTWWTQVNWWF